MNDGEGLLPDLIGWRDVIRILQVAIVDLRSRNESVDCDGMGAFDPDLRDFLLLHLEVLALSDLVAPANIFFLDDIAGFGIDELLLQPVSKSFLLIRLNATRSELDAAGQSAIGHDTKDSFK